MRVQLQAGDFFRFQRDVAVDEIIIHDAALLEEGAVGVEGFQSFLQRTGDLGDRAALFRRQVVEVLVGGRARIDAVLDAVQTGHQQGDEGQVGVAHRVGEAGFQTLGLGRGDVRDADRGRTVAGRIGQLHRGFIAGHQTLVGVGGRVGEGVDGLGVLDDAADVPQTFLRQAGVLVAGELGLAVLPDRHVDVHARAVVGEHGLGHEGRRLAVGGGHVVDHVFVELQAVGHGQQVAELQAQFMLRRGDLVVMFLGVHAQVFHHAQHFAAQVLGGIDGVDGEVAAFVSRAVAQVALGVFGAGVGRQFNRVEAVTGIVRRGVPAHVVEDEELGFRAEIDHVAHARGLDIGQGLLGHRAAVAVVGLARVGAEDVAEQEQRRLLVEGVDVGARQVRLQQHVGLVDGLPARDRRAVEHGAFFQELFIDHADVEGHVLQAAARIGEADVDVLDVFFLDLLKDLLGGAHSRSPVSSGRRNEKRPPFAERPWW
ncbi:hypothetical protein D3C85_683730 [compost metagenome]